ncbi:MAG: hypothetical protein LBT07_00850 [Endomicrobium sp.]|jgi:hypothetical protein|nr:hypothetical protein [Endomicrobium sp.]
MADFSEVLEFRDIAIKSAIVASNEKKEAFDGYVNFFLKNLFRDVCFLKIK